MTNTMNSVITAKIEATLTSPLDLVNVTVPLFYQQKLLWGSGTTASTADLMFTDTRTVAASGTDPLDLAGSLTGPLGATLTFVELRLLMICASSANTNNVRLNRPASNGVPLFLAASDGIDIPPGGIFLWVGPADGKVTVTAATGDLINIDNASSGTSVTYDVVILGTSA